MIDDLEGLEELLTNPSQPFTDTMQAALGSWLGTQKMNEEALQNPFIWLYTDIIEEVKLKFSFRDALGANIYADVNEDALACLHMSVLVNEIKIPLVPHWISAVLKTIDNIVVHYIQDYSKVKINKIYPFGEETSRYKQLELHTEPILSAGSNLYFAYDLRNQLEHRTVKDKNGKTILLKPNLFKVKKQAILFFRNAFKNFLSGYKIAYPQFIEI